MEYYSTVGVWSYSFKVTTFLLERKKLAKKQGGIDTIPCFSLRSSEKFCLIKSLPRQNQDKMETGKGFVFEFEKIKFPAGVSPHALRRRA